MIPFHSFLAAALLACACAAQAADVRKCVDARGKVTYVDGPCPRATQPERLRSPSPAPPAVAKLGAGVRFYEVEGIEHQALLASLNERGPNGRSSKSPVAVAQSGKSRRTPSNSTSRSSAL